LNVVHVYVVRRVLSEPRGIREGIKRAMTMRSLALGVSDRHFYTIPMVNNSSHSYFRYYSLQKRLMALVLVTSRRLHVQDHNDRGSRTRALSYTGNEACFHKFVDP